MVTEVRAQSDKRVLPVRASFLQRALFFRAGTFPAVSAYRKAAAGLPRRFRHARQGAFSGKRFLLSVTGAKKKHSGGFLLCVSGKLPRRSVRCCSRLPPRRPPRARRRVRTGARMKTPRPSPIWWTAGYGWNWRSRTRLCRRPRTPKRKGMISSAGMRTKVSSRPSCSPITPHRRTGRTSPSMRGSSFRSGRGGMRTSIYPSAPRPRGRNTTTVSIGNMRRACRPISTSN